MLQIDRNTLKDNELLVNSEGAPDKDTLFLRVFYQNEYVTILSQWKDFGRQRLLDNVLSYESEYPFRRATAEEKEMFDHGTAERRSAELDR